MIGSMLLFVVCVLLLHLPYRWERTWDFLGREAGTLRSLLYRYTYSYNYERLDYVALQRMQRWLLSLLEVIRTHFQPDLIIWLIEFVRQVLGL